MFSVSKFLKQQFYFIKKAKAGNLYKLRVHKQISYKRDGNVSWKKNTAKSKRKKCWDMNLRILRTKMMVNYIFNTEHISKSRLDKKIIFIMNENVKPKGRMKRGCYNEKQAISIIYNYYNFHLVKVFKF